MSLKPSPRPLAAASCTFLFFCVFALWAGGCEDKAIGRPCDVASDAGAMQAVFNGQALECPTRICVKPARQQGVAVTDTAPYCTATCSKDSDCDGESRDSSNPRDKRCKGGFVCGVATVTGSFCCTKVCLCRDFVGSAPVGNDPSCNKSSGTSTCQNL